MYGSEKKSSRIRAVQMDNFKGFEGTRRIDRILREWRVGNVEG